MPFQSTAQRRFMHAKHPEIAKRWEEHTPKGEKLPEKKSEKTAAVLLKTALELNIEKGDILLGGRFKNIPMRVDEIGTDELGQPTVNGKKLLAFRIKKEMPTNKTASSAVDLVLIKHHLDDAEETKHDVVKAEALKDAHEYAKDFKDKIPNKDRGMLNSYGIHKQALAKLLVKNS
jgi:hypothetical protein